MSITRKRVLLVDDEASPIRELRRCFEVSQDSDFRFDVEVASSVAEYLKCTSDNYFDVVVVDIRLEKGEEGIDTVVAYHRCRWPTTIIIVYSAFYNRDAVDSVVRAMKMGAADCIYKLSENSVKRVIHSAINELNGQVSNSFGPSSEWLTEHFPELQSKYGGKALAFVGNDIVCEAETVAALREKLFSQKVNGIPYVIVVPTDDKP